MMLAEEFPEAKFGEASSTAQLDEQVAKEAWNVIVLDLNLPGASGLDLVRHCKDASPSSGTLVYTVLADRDFGVRALRAGADGYVTKDRPAADLVHAIQRVREGKRYISESLAESLAEMMTNPEHAEPHHALSDREMQILIGLASGKTPTALADDLRLSIKTVSTYRSRILQKLRLDTTADMIRYALERKLIT